MCLGWSTSVPSVPSVEVEEPHGGTGALEEGN